MSNTTKFTLGCSSALGAMSRIVLLIVVMLVTSSCVSSGGGANEEVRSAIERLRTDYWFGGGFDVEPDFTPTMRALVELGSAAVPELTKELWDPQNELHRAAVVLVLGAIGDECAAGPLVANWRSRVSKARRVGGDRLAWRERFDAFLRRALGEIGGDVAAEALAEMYYEVTIPPHNWEEAWERASPRTGIVLSLIDAGGKHAVPPLIHALTVEEAPDFAEFREAALDALERWSGRDLWYDSFAWWKWWDESKDSLVFDRAQGRFRRLDKSEQ